MGKSKLMREIGRRLGVEPITAIRFMNAKDPATLIGPSRLVLIDALDEAISRQEGDAVDAVLAQLEYAGAPSFILSCRSREWQTRSVTKLHQIYRADPQILTLEPFTRAEAYDFLRTQHPTVDAEQALDHLTNHSLEELYRNPLTLGLMGQVAANGGLLPATRAELFEQVCTTIWPEHDPDRQDDELAQLRQDEAVDAAGAIAAAMLLAGAEAASAAGPAQVQQGDVRLAELGALPKAGAVRTIFSSKLFHSVGPSRAKPVHRVIAEFLGARWLALQAITPRAQRRLLAQLHGSGGVPASLRGLHAWLAYHSPTMAERIISADPYGVLRYGETASFPPKLAEHLFNALCDLARNDPYFRTADWDRKKVAGLMIPGVKSKVKEVIGTPKSNAHLRSLFIEALIETPHAKYFSKLLESIIHSSEYSLEDRYSAAVALIPHRNHVWQQKMIARLMTQGDNAPWLAFEFLLKIECDVSDAQLVDYLFVATELSRCPLPRTATQRFHIRKYYNKIIPNIPPYRLINILDLMTDYTEILFRNDHTNSDQIRYVVIDLIIRGINERVIGPDRAPSLWRWLGPIEYTGDDRSYRLINGPEEAYKLAAILAQNDLLRRALQKYGLDFYKNEESPQVKLLYLQRRLVGRWTKIDDVVAALDRLAHSGNENCDLRQDWEYLVYIGRRPSGFHAEPQISPELQTAAEKFIRNDAFLENILLELGNPEKFVQTIKQERALALWDQRFRDAVEKLGADRDGLRAGSLPTVLLAAQIYFNHFRNLPHAMPTHDGLAELIGTDLRDDAFVGFEAFLHRGDLPPPAQIARAFACGRQYDHSQPIMAGLYERLRNDKNMADLPLSLKKCALLLIYKGVGRHSDNKLERDLLTKLEGEVFSTGKAREDFARLWFEPSIASPFRSYLPSPLDCNPYWQRICVRLCDEWLTNLPNLSISVEEELINILAEHGDEKRLRKVAKKRAGREFCNSDQRLLWQSVDVLARFETVEANLKGIGSQHRDFIYLLDRRFHRDRLRMFRRMTIRQAEWIITEFRAHWPFVRDSGNPLSDNRASDFLNSLISWIADDVSDKAVDAMHSLIVARTDSYTDLMRHAAAEQRQKCVEKEFSALEPADLSAILRDGPVNNIKDLKTFILEQIDDFQQRLRGDDLDTVSLFWSDTNIPYKEDQCRDRLGMLLRTAFNRYDILQMTEVDMPMAKRADLTFGRGEMQIPIEIKGQWHRKVWDAATGQLEAQYLKDWKSQGHGIYCVLWFGDLKSKTNRRLKAPPDGLRPPQTAQEMHKMLVSRIRKSSREYIDIVVLDLQRRSKK